MIEISEKRLGVTAVLNSEEAIVGIITDGDIRRMLNKSTNIDQFLPPKTLWESIQKQLLEDAMAVEALND